MKLPARQARIGGAKAGLIRPHAVQSKLFVPGGIAADAGA